MPRSLKRPCVAPGRWKKRGERKEAKGAYEELLAATQPVYVRRSALAALIRLDKDGGEERVLSVLRGDDSALRAVAIAAVRTLPSKDASEKFAVELSGLPPEEQVWLIASLAARGDAAARAILGASLISSEAAVRRAAAGGLGAIGNATSVPLLARALAAAKRGRRTSGHRSGAGEPARKGRNRSGPEPRVGSGSRG